MRKTYSFLLALPFAVGLLWVGCDRRTGPLAPEGTGAAPLGKAAVAPSIEVKPIYRVPTGRPGERLTVFVFYERPAKPAKPPGGTTPTCSDPNTNQAFGELGVRLSASGFSVEYHPAFEPSSAAGMAFGAVDRGFGAWEAAVVNSELFAFAANPNGSAPPQRDNINVVGWRQLVGPNTASILAATWIWDDGSTILEADIFYNLKQKWAVNPAIEPGSTLCGTQFDVQAIGTHEIGHMFGLGHVSDDGNATNGSETDATMFGSAAKGELKKQTLTPGDVTGAGAVVPAPPPA